MEDLVRLELKGKQKKLDQQEGKEPTTWDGLSFGVNCPDDLCIVAPEPRVMGQGFIWGLLAIDPLVSKQGDAEYLPIASKEEICERSSLDQSNKTPLSS